MRFFVGSGVTLDIVAESQQIPMCKKGLHDKSNQAEVWHAYMVTMSLLTWLWIDEAKTVDALGTDAWKLLRAKSGELKFCYRFDGKFHLGVARFHDKELIQRSYTTVEHAIWFCDTLRCSR